MIDPDRIPMRMQVRMDVGHLNTTEEGFANEGTRTRNCPPLAAAERRIEVSPEGIGRVGESHGLFEILERLQLLPDPHAPGQLTEREREVVSLVAQGHTGPEIADELHIAHDTVRRHVHNAMTKTGARSRAHLVAKTLSDGQVLG